MLNDFTGFISVVVEGVCPIFIVMLLVHNAISFILQGILDHHFEVVHSLKEANSSFFFAEILPLFCQDVQTTLRDLSRTL